MGMEVGRFCGIPNAPAGGCNLGSGSTGLMMDGATGITGGAMSGGAAGGCMELPAGLRRVIEPRWVFVGMRLAR